MNLKEEEIVHFKQLQQVARKNRFGDSLHQYNCRICNPMKKLNLTLEEQKNVKEFITSEGWMNIDSEKITPNHEFDLKTYDLFVAEDLIKQRPEIDSWIDAKHAVEEETEKNDIRKTRKQGNAVVLTVTDFLELNKYYELSKEDSKVVIRKVEMKVDN